MIILGNFFLLALSILDRELALQALRTAVAPALEMFIGINVQSQQAAHLIRTKALLRLSTLLVVASAVRNGSNRIRAVA